jgi:hypothetical protein
VVEPEADPSADDPIVPPSLRKLHKRLNNELELYKLHLKHYHMSPAQFRRRTSELALPDEIYMKYERVCKKCKACSENVPAPSRSRVTGLRASEFGELVFVDHCEVSHGGHKSLVLLILDAASSLLWGSPQVNASTELTLSAMREWMDNYQVRPGTLVCDMFFTQPAYQEFYRTYGIKVMATGARTPWPNRAESAVRLFKRQFRILSASILENPRLAKLTMRDVVRECIFARNCQLTISGKTPLEMAFGRKPPDLLDVENMNPEQLSAIPLPEDRTKSELRTLALKSHLEARQAEDLRLDLANRLRPSDGPFIAGERVFVWDKDPSKVKDRGRWIRARVLAQAGPMVTVETSQGTQRVNQSELRRDMDEWRETPLPPQLTQAEPAAAPAATSSSSSGLCMAR